MISSEDKKEVDLSVPAYRKVVENPFCDRELLLYGTDSPYYRTVLERIFSAAIEAGIEVRMKDADGLEMYNLLIRSRYDNVLARAQKWTPRKELSLEQFATEGLGDQEIHYLEKISSIPREKPCTILRIAQLGYNLGQLLGAQRRELKQERPDAKKIVALESNLCKFLPYGYTLSHHVQFV